MSTERNSDVSAYIDDPDMPDFATNEEWWEVFENSVRRKLGISGEEFLRKVDAGEIVNDDRDAGVTALFMVMDGLADAQLHP